MGTHESSPPSEKDFDELEMANIDDLTLTIDTSAGHSQYSVLITTFSTLILGFVLLLCLWDTWSTFTDIIAPLETHLFRRVMLNIVLLVCAILVLLKFKRASKRMALFGNLLAGIGIWEMTESLIESAFGDALQSKLCFYLICLLGTYGLVIFLEKTNRLKVLDSGLL